MPLNLYQREKTFWVGGKNDHGIVIPRRSTKSRNLELAERCLHEINQLLSWSEEAFDRALEKALNAPPPPKPAMSLVEAKGHYLETLENRDSSRRAYETNVQKLLDFVDVRLVKDVTSLHCEKLQTKWLNHVNPPYALNTIRTYRMHTSTFMNYCVKRDWIASNPWKKVDPVKKKALTHDQIIAGEKPDEESATLPLDLSGSTNWLRIQSSIVPFLQHQLVADSNTRKRRANPLAQNPENFRALLELMYETGLRRSDAILFRPDNIHPTEQGGFSYTAAQLKTRQSVTIYPPAWLVEKIRKLPRLDKDGRFPFFDARRPLNNYLTSNLNRPLQELGDTIGIPGLRPHRFRDSFAVNCLIRGMSFEHLSELLGHKSIKTTRDHYAPFVKSRKDFLETQLMACRQGLLLPAPVLPPTVQTPAPPPKVQ